MDTFLNVLSQRRQNKLLNKKKINFSGRNVCISRIEKNSETEIMALCEQHSRKLYLFERFDDAKKCEDRFLFLKKKGIE